MKFARYLIGLLGGTALGFLFAPKKGEDLRKEIVTKGKISGTEGLKVLAKAFHGAGKEMVHEARELGSSEEIQEFLSYGEDKIRQILNLAEDHGIEFAAVAQEKLEKFAAFASQKAKELQGMAKKESKKGIPKIKKITGAKRSAVKK
ncbi:YtxH domain-containing protein [Candidatus Peregrinibacteria bacterium]|nr:YtxH domain-containing protein [Candidatus Peregrinibacteria bacterium]